MDERRRRSSTPTDSVRDARAVCETAFSFLISEFGLRADRFSFEDAGFTLRYLGPDVGVIVDWHPRDELAVWVVRLAAGQFPPRTGVAPHGQVNYFDLGFLEIANGLQRPGERKQLYALPTAATATMLGDSLHRCGQRILRGELAELAGVETLIKQRAQAAMIEWLGRQQPTEQGL